MPLLYKKKSPALGVWKIDESPEQLLDLSGNKAEYLLETQKFNAPARKAEWLAVRLLLREMLGFETPIAYRANGAPYLPESDYNISISHTKTYAAIILSRNYVPGIDIERRAERINRVRTRFLSKFELEWLENSNTDALLVAWSAKETVFKMTEKSASDFRRDIFVHPCGLDAKMGYVLVKELLTEQESLVRVKYILDEDYVLTYGYRKKIP